MPEDADSVASPCIGVCQLDAQSVCVGCARTMSEIVEWPRAAAERKRQILGAVRARRAATPAESQDRR